MLSEIWRQLTRFRRGTQNALLPPVRASMPSREVASSIPSGSSNDGADKVLSQTEYNETTGQTEHVFMLDVDPLDTTEAPLG